MMCSAGMCIELSEDPDNDVLIPDEGEADASTEELPFADGIEIAKIYLNQGVAIPVYENGDWVNGADRVADGIRDRAGLIRAFWSDAGDEERDITARLVLSGAVDHVYVSRKMVSGTSDVADPETTFNFTIAEDHLIPDVEMQIDLRETEESNDGADEASLWPEDGPGALEITDEIRTVKLTVVRVANPNCADGIPEIDDEEHWHKFHTTLYSWYPTNDFDVRIHDTILENAHTDWIPLLDGLISMRASDGEPENHHYFGYIDACANTFGSGTGSGGLAWPWSTVSGGIWWYEKHILWGQMYEYAWAIAAHEAGHSQGRRHFDACGAGGPFTPYPHADGELEPDNWGYGVVDGYLAATHKVYDKRFVDYMGYCDPQWTTLHTWNALWDGEVETFRSPFGDEDTMLIRVANQDGTVKWRAIPGYMTDERANSDERVRFVTKSGQTVEAPAYTDVLDNLSTYVAVRMPATLDKITEITYIPKPGDARANVAVDIAEVGRPAKPKN
ncbi:MAG: hypothetical protein B7733_22605 [Myxococcales bacterium FL481]|nr:MAG: hypothetical protein B7733_22605 [Myxococcales bacterium FL481]